MKLKNPVRLALTLLLVLLLLSGLGRLLRTQQPFSCFAPTYDENVHIEAVSHMIRSGKLTDYRMEQSEKPFDPVLSTGYPFALAGVALHQVTKRILPHAPLEEQVTVALRLATYLSFCFFIIALLRLSGSFQWQVANPWIPLVTLSLFISIWTSFPSAAYSVYGAFGESMSLFFAARAVRNWSLGRFKRSAVTCFLAIAVKPTLILLAPALALGAFTQKRRLHVFTVFSAIVGFLLLAKLALEASARGMTLNEHVSSIRAFAQAVALSSQVRLGTWFGDLEPMLRWTIVGTFAAVFAPIGFASSESARNQIATARTLLILSLALYVLNETSPNGKHLLCLISIPLWVGTSRVIHWLGWPLRALESLQHSDVTRAIIVTFAVAWFANVFGILMRSYKDADPVTCDAKAIHWVGDLRDKPEQNDLPRFSMVDLARFRQWAVPSLNLDPSALKALPKKLLLLKHTGQETPKELSCGELKHANLAQIYECELASAQHSR